MNSLRILFIISFLISCTYANTQDGGYKTPPKDISDMLLAKPTPNVSIDDKGEWMLLTESNSYPSVEELARPELRIAGFRINPNNYAPSRQNFINNIYLKNTGTKNESKITGLPSPLYAGNISWSPNDKKIAFAYLNFPVRYVVHNRSRLHVKHFEVVMASQCHRRWRPETQEPNLHWKGRIQRTNVDARSRHTRLNHSGSILPPNF